MFNKIVINQNWAKACPWLGIISLICIFIFYKPSEAIFWALINIPLYMFHQTEEHYIPGGFKKFMNERIISNVSGVEYLSDIKIFWVNIILVWVSFSLFGLLAFKNIGFGLCIVIFSIINCLTHIYQWIRLKCWNPGLVVASIQFLISIYAAYFISINIAGSVIIWWVFSVLFSIITHLILIKKILKM